MAAGDVNVDIVSPNAKAGAKHDGVDDKITFDVADIDPPASLYLEYLSTINGESSECLIGGDGFSFDLSTFDTSNKFGITEYGVANNQFLSSTSIYNAWTSIVVKFKAASTELYVNGVLTSTIASGFKCPAKRTAQNNSVASFLEGVMRNIRTYEGDLSTDRITAMSTGDFSDTNLLTHHWPLINDYKDNVGSADGTNDGTSFGIFEDTIAAAIKAARVTANDTFLLTECANGLQVVIPSIEEAP